MFLGVVGEISEERYESDKKDKNITFHLTLNENPLLTNVELPPDLKSLEYQNLICGAIRGAFSMLGLTGKVYVIKDGLKFNNEPTTFRVEMRRKSP